MVRSAQWRKERFEIYQERVAEWRRLNIRAARPVLSSRPHPQFRTLRWPTEPRGSTPLQCLTQAIYYEARSEPVAGQAAVAQVIINRTRSGRFPASVCGVVFQGADRPGCQFSFACDGSMSRGRLEPTAWATAERVASQTLAEPGAASIGSAVNYHANYVHPSWAQSLTRVAEIGRHIFYSLGGGLPAAAAAIKAQSSVMQTPLPGEVQAQLY